LKDFNATPNIAHSGLVFGNKNHYGITSRRKGKNCPHASVYATPDRLVIRPLAMDNLLDFGKSKHLD